MIEKAFSRIAFKEKRRWREKASRSGTAKEFGFVEALAISTIASSRAD